MFEPDQKTRIKKSNILLKLRVVDSKGNGRLVKLFILNQNLQSRKTFGKVRKAIPHSGYDPQIMSNDIGLLQVEDPGGRWTVRTICLPTRWEG